MICNTCGAENPEEAVYCMQCGNRLDGKKVCPKCGGLVDGAANFCMICGYRFSAPATAITPPSPTTLPADALAAAPVPVFEAVPADDAPAEAPNKKSVFNILGICGGAMALVSVFFSLIFVFCIGLSLTNGRTSEGNMMIYDYFYKVYDNIGAVLSMYTKDTGPLEASLYTPAVICTIVASLAFLAVPTFTAFAGVFFAKQMRDGKKRPFFVCAVAAYASFLVAACTIYAFSSAGVGGSSLSSSLASSEISFSFNGATTAGIALGGVFLGLATALLAASRGKEFVKPKTIVTTAIALVCIIPIVLGFLFTKQPQITATYASGSSDVYIDINAITACSVIGIMYINNVQLATPFGELTVAVLAAILQICILVLLAVVFIRTLRAIAQEKKSSGIVLSAVLSGASILNLVLNIVFPFLFDSYVFQDSTSVLSYSYVAPIVVLIMAQLILIASIANKIVGKKIN